MARLWRASIDAQAALPEVLWSVGLRGLNDYPYPCATPQVRGGERKRRRGVAWAHPFSAAGLRLADQRGDGEPDGVGARRAGAERVGSGGAGGGVPLLLHALCTGRCGVLPPPPAPLLASAPLAAQRVARDVHVVRGARAAHGGPPRHPRGRARHLHGRGCGGGGEEGRGESRSRTRVRTTRKEGGKRSGRNGDCRESREQYRGAMQAPLPLPSLHGRRRGLHPCGRQLLGLRARHLLPHGHVRRQRQPAHGDGCGPPLPPPPSFSLRNRLSLPCPLQSPSTASSPRWVRRRARPMRPTSSSTTRPTSSRAP